MIRETALNANAGSRENRRVVNNRATRRSEYRLQPEGLGNQDLPAEAGTLNA